MSNEVNNWWDGYLEFGPSGVPDDATSVKYIGEPYGVQEELIKNLTDLFHQSTTLKTIDLETICYLDNENIIWLFGRVGGYDFPLESIKLGFDFLPLVPLALNTLVSFLYSKKSSLQELFLSYFETDQMTPWLDVFTDNKLVSLSLRACCLFPQSVRVLLAGDNWNHLKHLDLSHNPLDGDDAFDPIIALMNREGSQLSSFQVKKRDHPSFNIDFNKEAVERLLGSLVGNSTMKIINVGEIDVEHAVAIQTCLGNVIGDFSTVQSVCNSNHTFCEMIYHCYDHQNNVEVDGRNWAPLDPRLTELLAINAMCIPVQKKIRIKLQRFFFKSDSDLQPFGKLDCSMVPKALGLFATGTAPSRDDDRYLIDPVGNLNGIYRVLRSQVNKVFVPSQDQEIECSLTKLKAENDELKRQLVEVQLNHLCCCKKVCLASQELS